MDPLVDQFSADARVLVLVQQGREESQLKIKLCPLVYATITLETMSFSLHFTFQKKRMYYILGHVIFKKNTISTPTQLFSSLYCDDIMPGKHGGNFI